MNDRIQSRGILNLRRKNRLNKATVSYLHFEKPIIHIYINENPRTMAQFCSRHSTSAAKTLATNGQDGNRLQLENAGPTCSGSAVYLGLVIIAKTQYYGLISLQKLASYFPLDGVQVAFCV